jgi:hypothetical protein
MWVAPEGVIYTSSDWDESQGSINIYQNGPKTGSFSAHGEAQGGAISGDATDVFAALQFNTSLGGSGYIGRYNRSTGTRDLTWSASTDTTERLADVITGIADTGTLVYVSDHRFGQNGRRQNHGAEDQKCFQGAVHTSPTVFFASWRAMERVATAEENTIDGGSVRRGLSAPRYCVLYLGWLRSPGCASLARECWPFA